MDRLSSMTRIRRLGGAHLILHKWRLMVAASFLLPNRFSQFLELGADLQPGPLRGVHVDLEAHLVAFEHEPDDATRFGERLCLADGESARLANSSEPFLEP